MNLKITCNTNPDLSGQWSQAEVEQEMREVDIAVIGNNDWLEYILGHTFDDVELPKVVYNAIMSEDVQSITFKTNHNDIVKCVKTR